MYNRKHYICCYGDRAYSGVHCFHIFIKQFVVYASCVIRCITNAYTFAHIKTYFFSSLSGSTYGSEMYIFCRYNKLLKLDSMKKKKTKTITKVCSIVDRYIYRHIYFFFQICNIGHHTVVLFKNQYLNFCPIFSRYAIHIFF